MWVQVVAVVVFVGALAAGFGLRDNGRIGLAGLRAVTTIASLPFAILFLASAGPSPEGLTRAAAAYVVLLAVVLYAVSLYSRAVDGRDV